MSRPRSFFDNLDKGSKAEGASGLGYIILENNNGKLEGKGPIAKFFSGDAINTLCKKVNAVNGDAIFFIRLLNIFQSFFCGQKKDRFFVVWLERKCF